MTCLRPRAWLALATSLIDCASRARLGHTGRSFRQPANRFSTEPIKLGTIVKPNAAQALQACASSLCTIKCTSVLYSCVHYFRYSGPGSPSLSACPDEAEHAVSARSPHLDGRQWLFRAATRYHSTSHAIRTHPTCGSCWISILTRSARSMTSVIRRSTDSGDRSSTSVSQPFSNVGICSRDSHGFAAQIATTRCSSPSPASRGVPVPPATRSGRW